MARFRKGEQSQVKVELYDEKYVKGELLSVCYYSTLEQAERCNYHNPEWVSTKLYIRDGRKWVLV